MANWNIEGCTVADANALARNNISAFWEDPTWILLWPKETTLEFLIKQSQKRYPHVLLSDREERRHQKAVDPETGALVGYARWILPANRLTAEDGGPEWPEAQIPDVGSEEKQHFEKLYKTAWWNARKELSSIDDKNSVVMDRILAERPYIKLDYLAVHPENKGKGIASALVESGIKHAEKIGVPIFVMSYKAGRGVYERLGFKEVDRVIQDDSPYAIPYRSPLGLKKIVPAEDAVDNTTIDIIAIHGLDTDSSRTWIYDRKDGSRAVHWLKDADMLPYDVREARIYTYDWNAKVFDHAPVQTLLGHADNLLAHVAGEQGSNRRPIIFIASCFGGLILAEAMNRAAQEGNPYRDVLLNTVGMVFLATPFRGSDAANPAKWYIIVGGIMGKKTSERLIDDLNREDKELRKLTQSFAELIQSDSLRIPGRCFYESETTKISKRLLPPRIASKVSSLFKEATELLLVTEDSACLDTIQRHRLDATHSKMNKFNGPESPNYKLVRDAVKLFARNAFPVMWRQNRLRRHFMVPFGRNERFVGRESILQQILERIPPSVNGDDCQLTAIEGLGGIGKTQIALEAAYRVREQHPECSIFWVPAVSTASFENAHREMGRKLAVQGIYNDKANIKKLVKDVLSAEATGSWLLIIDNADSLKLLFENTGLSKFLPLSRKSSILFTTRYHEVAVRFDIAPRNIIRVSGMDDTEATSLLEAGLMESQVGDAESTKGLLEFLANLPLAIKQASAYMASNMNVTDDIAEKQNPVATTWLISFKHIQEHNPEAAACLKSMCFLAEKDIPLCLLPEMPELKMAEAIGTLKAYALVMERNEPDSVDIHPLIQLAMRYWLLQERELKACMSFVVERLHEKYPFPLHENRSDWMRYWPHAQALFDFPGFDDEEFGDEEFDDKEVSNIIMLQLNLAESLSKLECYNDSEQEYLRILEISQEYLGKEHDTTLACMQSLSSNHLEMEKFQEAEHLSKETLELLEKTLDIGDGRIFAAKSILVFAIACQERYKEADCMYKETMETLRQAMGEEDPVTLLYQGILPTGILELQGRYEEAEELYRQKLERLERVVGKEDDLTLPIKGRLDEFLQDRLKDKGRDG
ncbi:hypothetical protein M426DRAFT_11415 [Hypoxylon sp. CI-4A]|nr:hypothetical protein M426DRAFT_11415 [Hypoxylon sp. CI-4A]